jgi:hypothetical protein
MSSSKISANTLRFLKEVREQHLKAKCDGIPGPNIATSEGPLQTVHDGPKNATAVGEALGTQGGTKIQAPKTHVIPEEEFHTILRPPYYSTWQASPGPIATGGSTIDGGFDITVIADAFPRIQAEAGINAIYIPPVDGYPISFSINATYDFDWTSSADSPLGLAEGAIQFTIALNGTETQVLSGFPVLWGGTSGQGQGTNVQYTSPIFGSFVGQAGAEYVISVGVYVAAGGEARATITGTITSLNLYTRSPENRGN